MLWQVKLVHVRLRHVKTGQFNFHQFRPGKSRLSEEMTGKFR